MSSESRTTVSIEQKRRYLLELCGLPPDTADSDLILTRSLERTAAFFSTEQRIRMLNLLGLPVDTTDADLVMERFEELADRAGASF